MKVAIYCWHSPYIALLSHIPDIELSVLPTGHAPRGWRDDQRVQPANVEIVPHIPVKAEVMILQNKWDLALWADQRENYRTDPKLVFLGHNRFEYEDQPDLARTLNDGDVGLVCISTMKALDWEANGYTDPIWVIPPGIPLQDEPWVGNNGMILTVANNIRRPLFAFDRWLDITRGLPIALVGEGNENIPGAVGPAQSWEDLKQWYQESAVYLNPTTGATEDIYNLSLLEAQSFGCPRAQVTESDPRMWLEWCLQGGPWAQSASAVARSDVQREFPMVHFIQRWQEVLQA